MKHPFIGAAAAALLVGLGTLPVAHAVPTLRLTADGSTTVTCADGDVCDANPLAGAVTFVGSVGVYILNVTTGASKPLLVGGNPLMDLNSIDITAPNTVSTNTLVIEFSDTSFVLPGTFTGEFGGVLSSGEGATVVATAFFDAGNGLFSQATAMGLIGPFGPGPFAGTFTDGLAPAGLYSVTEVITLRTVGASNFSGDFEVNVPEPTTLALLGLGLLGFAATRRRRQAS